MRFVIFEEHKSKTFVRVNVDHVITYFEAPEKDDNGKENPNAGKVVIVFLGGSVVVTESIQEVDETIAGIKFH